MIQYKYTASQKLADTSINKPLELSQKGIKELVKWHEETLRQIVNVEESTREPDWYLQKVNAI